MVRAVGAGVAGLLAAALLAGCGGSNPKPSPVTLPSATASATPSGAPTMPAEAKGTTPESAEAFVRYYLAAFTQAANSGEVDSLRALGAATCESCNGVIRRISATYSRGGHATGGYQGSDFTSSVSQDLATVTCQISSDQQSIFASSSASPSIVPAATTAARFHLVSRDGAWIVRDWTRT